MEPGFGKLWFRVTSLGARLSCEGFCDSKVCRQQEGEHSSCPSRGSFKVWSPADRIFQVKNFLNDTSEAFFVVVIFVLVPLNVSTSFAVTSNVIPGLWEEPSLSQGKFWVGIVGLCFGKVLKVLWAHQGCGTLCNLIIRGFPGIIFILDMAD